MSHPHLQVNANGEPFLALETNPDIIITPPRLSDIPTLPDLLNDPGVYIWLSLFPQQTTIDTDGHLCDAQDRFSIETQTVASVDHSVSWVPPLVEESKRLLQQLEEDPLGLFGGCPLRYIRKVNQDGSDVLIGDIGIQRCTTMELVAGPKVDQDAAKALQTLNNERKVGDPEILWSVGYFLVPAYAGRGIMSSAFKAVLEKWAIPRMGVRRMLASAYRDNIGSQNVLKKNGFVFREIFEKHIEARNQLHDVCVFDWRLEE
ncbi:hypothetical protein D9757_002311 [Collybiopsis confluens]|uniref:N-acetyltransferase domain-containing protein n=1 Tax=Collybiopsis confluens TaxID=2823264 RepID=A0A8H5HZQ6_9AGAR|nr:hypothetical protein D9757_002311 [Collybiopsis confluens]